MQRLGSSKEGKVYMNKGMLSSKTDEWETPQDLFNSLDAKYHFTLDPCATDKNAKCKRHFTKAENGLVQKWGGAFGVYEPAIRTADREMGAEGISRSTEARNSCLLFASGKD